MMNKSSPAQAEVSILLDENIPIQLLEWLQTVRPKWAVEHVVFAGLKGCTDQSILAHAGEHQMVVITFDEDFADRRMAPSFEHPGVVRLRVWPTNVENTKQAIERVLQSVPPQRLRNHLVIVDHQKIRVRKL